jgi:hypothetical protein
VHSLQVLGMQPYRVPAMVLTSIKHLLAHGPLYVYVQGPGTLGTYKKAYSHCMLWVLSRSLAEALNQIR